MNDVMMKREGLVYGMSEDQYHGQREFAGMFKDELSSTRAKDLLKNAAKFKYRIDHGVHEHSPAFDLGTAVHTKVLGTGEQFITYPAEHLTKSGNVSTKAATVAWEEEQRALGAVIITPDQVAQVDGMAAAVKAHPTASLLFARPGHAEVSVFDEYLGVKRRGRFDYLPDEGGIAVDLKTTVDASKAGFEVATARYGYHIQRAHYLDILKRATGREADMLFVVVEKTAPYLVAVHRCSQQFIEMGEVEAMDAVDTYRRCIETGEWPGYPDEITELVPPMFSIYEHQDKYENGEITL